MKISVIGLGKLGAPLAAVFASKGFPVIGTDLNPAFVNAINAGRAPVDEHQPVAACDSLAPRPAELGGQLGRGCLARRGQFPLRHGSDGP